METSAVTGQNVKRAFYKLAETLIHSYGIFQPGQEVSINYVQINYMIRLTLLHCMLSLLVMRAYRYII